MRNVKHSRVHTAVRNFSAWVGTPPSLPAARIWRIIPQSAAAYAVGSQAVAAGICRATAPGTLDGAWPVWVRLTDPDSHVLNDRFLMVNHEGWQFEPTGPGWRIEVVAALPDGPAADRFLYAIETLDDPDQAYPIVANAVQAAVTATVSPETTAAANPGESFDVAVGAADANAATVAGRILRLTAAGGDVFYAIDADSTLPANRVLLMAGASEYVRAGATIHYSDGPTPGAQLYVAQLP